MYNIDRIKDILDSLSIAREEIMAVEINDEIVGIVKVRETSSYKIEEGYFNLSRSIQITAVVQVSHSIV